MKLKKLLALALAGVLMLALLTGCSGGGNGEDRLVAEAVADIFKGNSQNVEVSYSVPALTRTIRPAFTPDWFLKTPEGIIDGLDENFPIDAGQRLKGFLENSLKAYEQSNFVTFYAFDSNGMSALQQVERFSSGAPLVGVYNKDGAPAPTKLRVGVCHKTVEGREYCLVVIVRAR